MTEMAVSNSPTRPLSAQSLILGGLCFATCLAVGYANIPVREIFNDFGLTGGWQASFIRALNPTLASIFGACAAALIIWKDRVTSRQMSHYVNSLAIIALVSLGAIWLFAAFSPLFVLYEVRPPPIPPQSAKSLTRG
jgi:hypothetical protein